MYRTTVTTNKRPTTYPQFPWHSRNPPPTYNLTRIDYLSIPVLSQTTELPPIPSTSRSLILHFHFSLQQLLPELLLRLLGRFDSSKDWAQGRDVLTMLDDADGQHADG